MMMLYRKLKRTWSHNSMNYTPRFRETFPELNNINDDEMVNRFIKLKLDFFTEEKTKVNFLTRLTLPFALIMMLIMLIGLPFNFFITGKWSYELNTKNHIYNWFKALKF